MAKVSVVETGYFKLDGGAMFGLVPRQLWEKLNPPDEKNRCTWSMRCLLVETGDRKILIDTGIGHKQGEKFRSHFEPHGEESLRASLEKQAISPEAITDVLLTHLHFDHVGGAVQYDEFGRPAPTFPNAAYWTNEPHYRWAINPNIREKPSFLPENFEPLRKAGRLHFIHPSADDVEWMPDIQLRFVYGHTEAMMAPIIDVEGQTLVYCADVIPSHHHLRLPYIMAFDVRPLHTLEEKERIIEAALADRHLLFFEHDPQVACGFLAKDEKGRAVLEEPLELETALRSKRDA